jgi:hypothetical protein
MKQYKAVFVIALTLLFGCQGCATANIESTFTGKSEGPVMKKYLHYCTYEIWEGFREDIKYQFLLTKVGRNDVGGFDIWLNELPKTDNIDELINIDVSRHKLELTESKKLKYFSDVQKKKIKIADFPAMLALYSFNPICIKGDSYFDQSVQIIEICYIQLKDKTIKLKMENYVKYCEPLRPELEEFYMSYKPDQSQAVKTNYGSFKWMPGLKDESTVEYCAIDPSSGSIVYSITISYIDEKNKAEENAILDRSSWDVPTAKGSATVKHLKGSAFEVDGRKIQYDEYYSNLGEKGIWKKASIRLYDFSPGVDISIDENTVGKFDKYRREMDALVKSFQFFPEIKK